MVLTEAFAAGTPVVASDIAGYRDVVRDGVDGVLVPPADPQALAEALRDLYEEPARRDRDGPRRGPRRRALRLAAGRRAGDRGLRGRDRHSQARGPRPACRRRHRRAGGRSQAAREGQAPAEPRAAARRRARAAGRSSGARRWRRSRWAAIAARGAGAEQDRARQHRRRADQLEPLVRAARPGDHVQRDGDARVLLERDPARGAAQGQDQARRRHAGDVHRRADVLDAAGAAR